MADPSEPYYSETYEAEGAPKFILGELVWLIDKSADRSARIVREPTATSEHSWVYQIRISGAESISITYQDGLYALDDDFGRAVAKNTLRD